MKQTGIGGIPPRGRLHLERRHDEERRDDVEDQDRGDEEPESVRQETCHRPSA